MTQHSNHVPVVDPRLEEALRLAVGIGAVILVLLPDARGHSEVLGWLPLWLLGMPLTAWWALHRFRLPGERGEPVVVQGRHPTPRRRVGAQARRRTPRRLRIERPHAA